MEIKKVEVFSHNTGDPLGYYCRFCNEQASSSTKKCPECGIPFPSQEAMGQKLMIRLLVTLSIFGLAGWFAGGLLGSLVSRILGVLAGIIIGLIINRRYAGRSEIRMRTYALLQLSPNAINKSASEIAAQLGTTLTGVISQVLKRKKARSGSGPN